MLLVLTLVAASFASAVLSATLGMAGGLVLIGAFTALLPVPEAMVLHGLTQLVANGGRAVVHRQHLARGGLVAYAAGAAAATALAAVLALTPSRAAVYLGVGLVPFVVRALPRWRWLDASRPLGATVAGFLVVGTQAVFGVAGPLLDVFFLGGSLDRHGVVATKAATQVLSHALKVLRFLPLVVVGSGLLGTAAACMVAAALGTQVGTALLERVSEAAFRRWTQRVVLLVGGVYVGLGVAALA